MDVLRTALKEAAEDDRVPPLDMARAVCAGRRRRRRTRGLRALAAGVVVVTVLVGVHAVVSPDSRLVSAGPTEDGLQVTAPQDYPINGVMTKEQAERKGPSAESICSSPAMLTYLKQHPLDDPSPPPFTSPELQASFLTDEKGAFDWSLEMSGGWSSGPLNLGTDAIALCWFHATVTAQGLADGAPGPDQYLVINATIKDGVPVNMLPTISGPSPIVFLAPQPPAPGVQGEPVGPSRSYPQPEGTRIVPGPSAYERLKANPPPPPPPLQLPSPLPPLPSGPS